MTSEGTERVKEVWDSQAASWFRQREALLTASRPIHEWMVDHLELRPGMRVLIENAPCAGALAAITPACQSASAALARCSCSAAAAAMVRAPCAATPGAAGCDAAITQLRGCLS